jgi:hypothetical protein
VHANGVSVEGSLGQPCVVQIEEGGSPTDRLMEAGLQRVDRGRDERRQEVREQAVEFRLIRTRPRRRLSHQPPVHSPPWRRAPIAVESNGPPPRLVAGDARTVGRAEEYPTI